MGIPCFYSYIIKNYSKIVIEMGEKCDNLYIDGNSLIYDSYNEIISKENNKVLEKEIIKEVIEKICDLVCLISPSKTCLIAFDGVAPLAKLNQQRIRRFKSSYEKDLLNDIYKKNDKPKWDTNSITPGTFFMKNLAEHINRVNFNIKLSSNCNFIISSSEEPGEGEHKIFNYIRQNKQYHLNTETIIYGLDADLIMLSLNHTELCKNIFLYRETPAFIKNINTNLNPKKNYLLNITNLKHTINNDFGSDKRIDDYIFICFLLGNDFMPHIPSVNIRTDGIDVLMNCYKDCILSKKRFLIENNTIVWKNFKIFIEKLSEDEHTRLKEEYNKRSKYRQTKKSVEDKILMLPMIDRNIEMYINPSETKWQQRYYNKLFNCNNVRSNNIIKNICINYLEILEWTFKYYRDDCYDWRFQYNYTYAPLLSDLVIFIPYFNTNYIKKTQMNNVHPYTQLSYVLPETSSNLLPEKIKNYMIEKHSEYYNDFSFAWAFCKFFWEAKINFTELDINVLENDIKSILEI